MNIILIFISIFNVNFLCAHKFLDSDQLDELFSKEAKLIEKFEEHITEYQQKLDALKLKISELKNEHVKAFDSDKELFSNNPVNIFKITRRFCVDWFEIDQLIFNENFSGVVQSYRNIYNFPTKDDLQSSVSAFFWLQDIYNLSTSSLIKGEVNGINFNTSLSFKDCMELGFTAYLNRDFYHAALWMKEALNNLSESNKMQKKRILNVLAESYYEIGDINNALNYSNEIVKLSNDSWSKRTNEFFKSKANSVLPNSNTINEFPRQLYKHMLGTDSKYYLLCRNLQNRNSERGELNCFYENKNVPFLLIAPFKKEILNLDPLVVIFHDVLYDDEIMWYQNSVTNLEYSKVYDISTKKSISTTARLSKHKWVYEDKENQSVLKIRKRADDMTNLNTYSSDALNINYYEIGGYYTPHFDFFKDTGYAYGKDLSGNGNRIATLIFYLNDVEQGGATVFTDINISVQPKKGSALFWYNLYSSGEYDYRTYHAACPVLIGHKYISTFWIREKLQDIHRPCIETSRILI